MGQAYIIAHHHIHTDDGWMTARQAADRGHGTLLTNHVYPKLYSLCLVGGGNIIINTTATLHQAPTQIAAATMGYFFEPSTDPQLKGSHKGSLTYPTPQEANPREGRATQGLDTTLPPKTIAQPESDTVTKMVTKERSGKPTMPTGLSDTSHPEPTNGQQPLEKHLDDLDTANLEMQAIKDLVFGKVGSKVFLHFTHDAAVVTVHLHRATILAPHLNMSRSPLHPPALEACGAYPSHQAPSASVLGLLQKKVLAPTTNSQLESDTEIEHTSTTNQDTAEKSPNPYQDPTHEPQTDIYLSTPTGGRVPWLAVQWELNPYAAVCGDTSGLMGIVPGHHHLWATTLCALVQTDLRSQFYKTPPARESRLTLQPVWSLGKEKVIKSQKRSASRRQALGAREHEINAADSPPVTTSLSTLSQNHGKPTTNDEIYQEAIIQEPIDERTAVPLKDNILFYKNRNPKPPSTWRLPIRGLTRRERKRPGGRKKDRRRDQRLGTPTEGPKELNPETAERTNEEDDPIQTLNVDRDKIILFSFIKYAVGKKNRETQTGLISSEPPTQHMATIPNEHPVEPDTDI